METDKQFTQSSGMKFLHVRCIHTHKWDGKGEKNREKLGTSQEQEIYITYKVRIFSPNDPETHLIRYYSPSNKQTTNHTNNLLQVFSFLLRANKNFSYIPPLSAHNIIWMIKKKKKENKKITYVVLVFCIGNNWFFSLCEVRLAHCKPMNPMVYFTECYFCVYYKTVPYPEIMDLVCSQTKSTFI